MGPSNARFKVSTNHQTRALLGYVHDFISNLSLITYSCSTIIWITKESIHQPNAATIDYSESDHECGGGVTVPGTCSKNHSNRILFYASCTCRLLIGNQQLSKIESHARDFTHFLLFSPENKAILYKPERLVPEASDPVTALLHIN